jgi:D-alanine-D-alanine ligase
MSGYTTEAVAPNVMIRPPLSEENRPIRVMHMMGGTSEFYFDLSVMYGRTAAEFEGLDLKQFTHEFVVVFPDGRWAFPRSMHKASLDEAKRFSMGQALATIENMSPPVDVVMPHMFCMEGMTRYRSLVEMLGIEVLGCSSDTCSVANDKFLTKQVCEAAGVPVPKAQYLQKPMHGEDLRAIARQVLEARSPPFIVKPARDDNSLGLSLVRTATEEAVAEALEKAFERSNGIVVEEYIAGREVRVALLEQPDGEGMKLEVLPKIEYLLDDIRTSAHKLATNNGQLLSSDDQPAQAIIAAKKDGDRVCPAQLEPEVHARLDDLARRAHKALGCTYYSLYDVRIDEHGFPFMLEAALFCSFSPYSVIVSLASKSGNPDIEQHPSLFERFLRRAADATRSRRATKSHQKIADDCASSTCTPADTQLDFPGAPTKEILDIVSDDADAPSMGA